LGVPSPPSPGSLLGAFHYGFWRGIGVWRFYSCNDGDFAFADAGRVDIAAIAPFVLAAGATLAGRARLLTAVAAIGDNNGFVVDRNFTAEGLPRETRRLGQAMIVKTNC
jgi:hypothetical protein